MTVLARRLQAVTARPPRRGKDALALAVAVAFLAHAHHDRPEQHRRALLRPLRRREPPEALPRRRRRNVPDHRRRGRAAGAGRARACVRRHPGRSPWPPWSGAWPSRQRPPGCTARSGSSSVAEFTCLLAIWGLAGLVSDTRQAKQFFPLIAAGGVVGLIMGGLPQALAATSDRRTSSSSGPR